MPDSQDKVIKDVVKEQFSRNADKYVTSESHGKSEDLALLVQLLEPEPDWRVLDIATGGGHTAKSLAPHVAQVFATDLTREMLVSAHRYVTQHADNVWFIVADAENLPFFWTAPSTQSPAGLPRIIFRNPNGLSRRRPGY